MTSLTRRARLLVLTMGLLLMAARPASAAIWWLTWLDELSGPGPYHGPIISVDVWCFGTRTLTPKDIQIAQGGDPTKNVILRPAFCDADRANTIFGLQLEMGFWNDNPSRYSGDVHLKSFQLVGYFPLHKIFQTDVNRATRAIELGAGLGAYKLTGQPTVIDPDYWRGSVPLRVRVIPSEFFYGKGSTGSPLARRALQAIQVRAGWDFLPGTVSSDSFIGLPNGKKSNEFVKTVGVQFDLGSLFWAVVKRESK